MEAQPLVSEMQEMEEQQLVTYMEQKLFKMVEDVIDSWLSIRNQKSFCRVPSQLREGDDFDPKFVSIGQLHINQNHKMEEMQKIQWEYMRIVLQRGVHGLEESARRRYLEEEIPNFDKDEFIEMLVLDACFLIEFCCYQDDHSWVSLRNVGISREELLRDILLIENQIPFQILKAVYLSVFPDNQPMELLEGLRRFFFPNEVFKYSSETTDYVNLLHFYCENLRYVKIHDQQQSNMAKLKNYVCYPYKFFLKKLRRYQNEVDRLPIKVMKTSTAAECVEAGLRIKATNRGSFIPHIMYTNGTLTIQRIEMNRLTYSTLQNIILAEEWTTRNFGGGYQVPEKQTSEYVCFLCSLVKSEADYKVLEEKGVVSADSIKDGMLMFDRLKRLPLPKLHPEGRAYRIRSSIEEYVAEPYHRWRENLVRDYFSSPWSVIALVVGFVVFVLTALQTVYTILGYYYNKN